MTTVNTVFPAIYALLCMFLLLQACVCSGANGSANPVSSFENQRVSSNILQRQSTRSCYFVNYTTELHEAAFWNDYERAKCLLDDGADLTQENWLWQTPFQVALYQKSFDVAMLFANHYSTFPYVSLFDFNKICTFEVEQDATMLIWRIKKARGTLVEEDRHGRLIAFTYEMLAETETLRIMLDHQDVSLRDGNVLGWSQIHHEAYHGRVENVLFHITQDEARMDYVDAISARPLHYAAYNNHFEVVRTLVEHGSHVNVIDKSGFTALHIAASNGYLEIVEYLLEKKANVDELTDSNHSPIDLAALNGQTHIVDVLQQKGACIKSILSNYKFILHRMALLGHCELVQKFVKLGATVRRSTTSGCSLLYLAVLKGHRDLVEALIVRGENIREMGSFGRTLLHVAAGEGHYELVKMLMEKGIDPNVTDNDGRTPVHDAARHGHANVVVLLHESGGNLLACDANNMTPILFAIHCGHINVTQYIDAKCDGHNLIPSVDITQVPQQRQDVSSF